MDRSRLYEPYIYEVVKGGGCDDVEDVETSGGAGCGVLYPGVLVTGPYCMSRTSRKL